MRRDKDVRCACGHDREAHEHYRAGSDCAGCADRSCVRYRSAGGVLARAARALLAPREVERVVSEDPHLQAVRDTDVGAQRAR